MPLAAFLLMSLSAGSVAEVECEDYMIFFAANTIPYQPARLHSFAALVRIEKAVGCPARLVEVTSLSWLPATLTVKPFRPRSELGWNVPLDTTLDHYIATGRHIHVWGPYRVCPELAEKFKARVAAAEAGFEYKALCLFAARHINDCARSVEETVESRRRYIGPFGYGTAATSVIVQKCSPWLIEPEHTHDWVATMIGLDAYPLERRCYGDYTTRKDQLRAWMHGK